jgi:hypothetical protein
VDAPVIVSIKVLILGGSINIKHIIKNKYKLGYGAIKEHNKLATPIKCKIPNLTKNSG